MSGIDFIVASCRDWHRPGFERIRQEIPGHWVWVSTADELVAAVSQGAPRYVFFLHWNWLVPRSIWSKIECVCFHMTDVPFGRGGSPLQNLIAAGQTKTMLTALRMVQEMDAGPVYAKRPLSLEGRAEDIYLRAGKLSMELVAWIVASEPEPVEQRGEPVIFKRRTPEQSQLPDSGELGAIYDHIRMLDAPGYPFAYLDYGEFRIEFRYAELEDCRLEARAVFKKRPSS